MGNPAARASYARTMMVSGVGSALAYRPGPLRRHTENLFRIAVFLAKICAGRAVWQN